MLSTISLSNSTSFYQSTILFIYFNVKLTFVIIPLDFNCSYKIYVYMRLSANIRHQSHIISIRERTTLSSSKIYSSRFSMYISPAIFAKPEVNNVNTVLPKQPPKTVLYLLPGTTFAWWNTGCLSNLFTPNSSYKVPPKFILKEYYEIFLSSHLNRLLYLKQTYSQNITSQKTTELV